MSLDDRTVHNPPGLDRIAYRPSDHGRATDSLEAATGDDRFPGLGPLTTRAGSDWTLSFLDAVASLAHVVSFYAERQANESYLRTATERLSIRQLARLVDYELRPGKAADVHVQFDLDDREDVPAEVDLPPGIAVDSVPGPDEELQHYETVEALTARRTWAALRPRLDLAVPVAAARGATSSLFRGADLRIVTGDLLLFNAPAQPPTNMVRTATAVDRDATAGTTRITHAAAAAENTPIERVVDSFGYNAGGWRVEHHPRVLADLTGDGTADIVGFGNAGVWVALNKGDGTFGPVERVVDSFGYIAGGWRVERHPRVLADLTGDGTADIVGFGNAGVWVALNKGDGTFGPVERVVDSFGYNAGGWRVERHPRVLADLTGDGTADIVGFGNAGVWVALNKGDGTFGPVERVVDSFGYNAGGWRVERHPRVLADLTGDGTADIVGFGNAGVWVALNKGDGTFGPVERVVDSFGYNAGGWRVERHPRVLADLTGDGTADIVGFGNAGVWVALNKGDGTFGPVERVVDNFGYNAGGWRVERHPRVLADLTGDGTADIVGFGNAGVWVALNKGDGTFGPVERVVDNFGYNAGGWRVERHPRVLADLTGDGTADIVGFGNAGVYVRIGAESAVAGYTNGLWREIRSIDPGPLPTPRAITSAWVRTHIDGRAYRMADVARPLAAADLTSALIEHLDGRGGRSNSDSVSVFRSRASLFGLRGPVKSRPEAASQVVGAVTNNGPGQHVWLPLDNIYDNVGPGSKIAVLDSASPPLVFDVLGTDQSTKVIWEYSATVTRVLIAAGSARAALLAKPLATTSVAIQNESIDLAPEPIDEPVEGTLVDLGRLDLHLLEGRSVAVAGEVADLPGVRQVDVRRIDELYVVDGRTVVVLDAALTRALVRSTVEINANVVKATHGQTVQRVLGSGNAATAFQTFVLPDAPLTFVGAATATGTRPEIELRVDGVRWHPVRRLVEAGGDDRVFELRHHENGSTSVRFGDGITGARLATGVENVRAAYRVGVGTSALVGPGQLTLLGVRPLGVKGVTNPEAATDASDGDTLESARATAPTTIMTLGRVVSLRDHEDFARSFAGIAKASATWVWDGSRQAVVVTVAGDEGAVFPAGSEKVRALRDALISAGDGSVPISIVPFRPVPFVVAATIKVHADHVAGDVLGAVEAALRAKFGFANRQLGQWVAKSEVLAVMQGVPGVVYVDIDTFNRAGAVPAGLSSVIAASAPAAGSRTSLDLVDGTELLMIDTRPLKLGVRT